MAVAVTVTKKGRSGRLFFATGTLVFSGSYVTASGEPLDLSSYFPFGSAKQPDFVAIQGEAGFVYTYDLSQKSARVFVNTAGGANTALGEHTSASYVAGITGDTVNFIAFWFA